MSYDKQTWADTAAGGTPINAERLTHLEDGIGSAHDGLADKADVVHTHVPADITGAAPVGINLLTATSAAVARAAIGAVTVGSTSQDAAPGDHTHTPAAIGAAAAVHTHTSANVTDIQEFVEDTIGASITAGTNVTVAYNGTTGKVTINSTASGGASANPRLGVIRVASSEATTEVKAQCDYVCTGTNDQTIINTALIAATRPGDALGGIGAGAVELVGPNFYVGNNNTGVILMPPSVWLRGSGPGTFIQPMFSSFTDLGAIQLYSNNTDHTRVSDLTIGRPDSILSRSHGLKYDGTGSGSVYQLDTGSDPFHRVHDINVLKTSGHGLYFLGTSGGCRESHIDHVLTWDSTLSGFYWSGSSDSKFTSCTAQCGSGGPGFFVGGGNTKIVNSKAYYADGANDGFSISSSRAELIACAAQDNGRYGFNVTAVDVTMAGCVADSNARIDATGGGFLVGAAGNYSGISAFDRGQTPGSPQLRGIIFSGSPQVAITGRVSVPSGSAQVVGSPGSNSLVRVVRNGTTPYTFGDPAGYTGPTINVQGTAPSSPATGQVWIDTSA